jgi:hypothetical protein
MILGKGTRMSPYLSKLFLKREFRLPLGIVDELRLLNKEEKS